MTQYQSYQSDCETNHKQPMSEPEWNEFSNCGSIALIIAAGLIVGFILTGIYLIW